MPVTVRSLIDRTELGLKLLEVPEGSASWDAAALDAEIAWAHASDLTDPTPWLEAGQLLLTDGSHLDPETLSDADAAAYVARLRRVGLTGLGYAVGVVHDEVPARLAEACIEARLPLIVVPKSVPFIRIIRHVADVIAEDRNRNIKWSLDAQRAIARATLRPDGLAATLRELEVQLGGWVALYDRLGRRVPVRTQSQPPAEVIDDLDAEVAATLAAGRRAATRISGAGQDITLQTIGSTERLNGVLAVGAAVPLGRAGSDLLASVIGIASIAIEQGRELDQARRELRTGVFELYRAGSVEAAARTLERIGSWVPQGQVRLAVVSGVAELGTLLEQLELHARSAPFGYARVEDELILYWEAERTVDVDVEMAATYGLKLEARAAVLPERLGEPPEVARIISAVAERGFVVGVSSMVEVTAIDEGLREAHTALRRAVQPGQVVEFGRLADQGMLAWLEANEGELPAGRLLAPLLERVDAQALVESVRVWFAHNCAWDPAARELGIHRHTLRGRVDAVGEICGLDLSNFAARAELWAALQLV